jgi:HAD superfamily hydrolase (TIGR01549 family)
VISTLFFDGDQTLWDFDKLMRRVLRQTLAELRLQRPAPVTDRLDVEAMVDDRQAVAAELAEHLNAFYLERRFADVELYPDTIPALTTLRRTYTLGLLSNGNSYPERSGLSGIFAVTVFSQDHGIAKPDRRLYEIAAAEVGATAEAIAMIGDSLVNDVTAAQAAGWQGIWLNRESIACPDLHTPDAEIASLIELPEALAKAS